MALRNWALFLGGVAACAGGDSPGEDEEGTGETQQAVSAQSGAIAASVESDSEGLGGYNIDGIEPASLTVFHLHVTATAKWEADILTSVNWDGDKVRQGQTLDVKRTSTAFGNMKVLWTLSGVLRPLDLFDVDIGSIPIAADILGCSPKLDGSEYECEAESPSIPIVPGILPFAPYVDFNLGIKFKITPNTGTATRTLMLGDEQGAQGELTLTADEQTDSQPMPCNKPVGTTIDYVLDPQSWSPSAVEAIQQPKFAIGTMFPVPPFGIPLIKLEIFSGSFGPAVNTNPSFTLDGAGDTLPLGELQANNVNPTIDAMSTFNGSEGSPVAFSATTHSACPITSYVWNFSNGTTSYGPTPFRTFGDDGMFDGQLTVTDMTGLSGSNSLQVSITNVAPSPNAGPDTSGAWGQPIALTGQAVDPGTDDQSTLVYTWTFGDGTPGAGGASTSHAYALPGDYVATLKVCDDHVCTTDTTNVTVRKRTTSVGYTGTNVGTYSAQAQLMGSIVDEFGQPVVGGTLDFSLAFASAGSAQTNASGNAARTIDITIPRGTYPVSVAYAGNAFYDGGAAGELFDVAVMSSTMQYTGALGGGANKTVNLSATLVDAQNRALAGKLVTFQLGAQTATATTNASGVAATTLKLAQKNASYPLTATWAPAGGDADRWSGSVASVNFSIGGK